jgi:hypothetical protein
MNDPIAIIKALLDHMDEEAVWRPPSPLLPHLECVYCKAAAELGAAQRMHHPSCSWLRAREAAKDLVARSDAPRSEVFAGDGYTICTFRGGPRE